MAGVLGATRTTHHHWGNDPPAAPKGECERGSACPPSLKARSRTGCAPLLYTAEAQGVMQPLPLEGDKAVASPDMPSRPTPRQAVDGIHIIGMCGPSPCCCGSPPGTGTHREAATSLLDGASALCISRAVHALARCAWGWLLASA